jgi:hypothetical protein
VDADDGPVGHRTPLPDLPGIRRDRGGRRPPGRGLGPLLGFPVEPCLGRRVVDDVVLGVMALRSVDALRHCDPRRAEREGQRQGERRAHRDY